MRVSSVLVSFAFISLMLLQPRPTIVVAQSGLPGVDLLDIPETTPIVSDHSYRASGAIRPFVLFWISKDDVGGGRITRRRADDGTLSLEMLTGSDPTRAPFKTNRWGYIREVARGEMAELVAVKTPTEEDSIEEAKKSLKNPNASRFLLFMREQVTAREAVTWSTLADVGREVTYRDLEFVLGQIPSIKTWEERRIARPPEARPGFLIAFNELMEATISAWTAAGGSKPTRLPSTLLYLHRADLYDLLQDHIELFSDFDAGVHGRTRAVRSRFRIHNRKTGKTSGEFTAVYGVAGALAAVPLRMTYQPRWWLRTELALDESTKFSAAAR